MPYEASSLERLAAGAEPKPHPSDARSAFARDRDRVLYSTAFRRLAGKTQVVAASEAGLYHNRLTHSLKVAQLGRRLAERLRSTVTPTGAELTPPDPDLVEAACLAHDLGHPPFGHVGERTLRLSFDVLTPTVHAEMTNHERAELGGFEGNAQSFRVLTYLAARVPIDPRCGLDLTRATLDAATKYPWLRTAGDPEKIKKWGAYGLDSDRLRWVREAFPLVLGARQSFEAQLMDWCDDVTYAVHDVIDFYRGGQIPLDRLLRFAPGVSRAELAEEAIEFLDVQLGSAIAANKWNPDDVHLAWASLAELSDIDQPWEPTLRLKAAVQAVTSRMITYFVDDIAWAGDLPCRHDGDLTLDSSDELARLKRLGADLLKELLRVRVIEQPALATQQEGQARIVQHLLGIYCKHPELLPADRREDYLDHGDRLRAASDHVASLTESDAQSLFRRLTGIQLGAVTDVV